MPKSYRTGIVDQLLEWSNNLIESVNTNEDFAVLALSSMVEESLKTLLQFKFIKMEAIKIREINRKGTISNFLDTQIHDNSLARNTEICYELNLISLDLKKNLDKFRIFRNEFIHEAIKRSAKKDVEYLRKIKYNFDLGIKALNDVIKQIRYVGK